jgi:hypothetical protein
VASFGFATYSVRLGEFSQILFPVPDQPSDLAEGWPLSLKPPLAQQAPTAAQQFGCV